MPDSTTANPPVDLARIDDPEVRRALRSLQAEFAGKLSQMQIHIDALVQLLVDKHIGSLGEFRREVAKLQQDHGKLDRLHRRDERRPDTCSGSARDPQRPADGCRPLTARVE